MKTTTTRRPDDTRLRTKRGRYVAECAHCMCPAGCGCDGVSAALVAANMSTEVRHAA